MFPEYKKFSRVDFFIFRDWTEKCTRAPYNILLSPTFTKLWRSPISTINNFANDFLQGQPKISTNRKSAYYSESFDTGSICIDGMRTRLSFFSYALKEQKQENKICVF